MVDRKHAGECNCMAAGMVMVVLESKMVVFTFDNNAVDNEILNIRKAVLEIHGLLHPVCVSLADRKIYQESPGGIPA